MRAGRQMIWWLLIVAVALIPAVEFVCDGSSGVAHEGQHAHASPGLVGEARPTFMATLGAAVLLA